MQLFNFRCEKSQVHSEPLWPSPRAPAASPEAGAAPAGRPKASQREGTFCSEMGSGSGGDTKNRLFGGEGRGVGPVWAFVMGVMGSIKTI